MKQLIITLRVYRGKVTYDAQGKISSENQTMKLRINHNPETGQYEHMEWTNFCKTARNIGFTKAEIIGLLDVTNRNDRKQHPIPEILKEQCAAAIAGPTKQLSKEEQRIADLEAKVAALSGGKAPKSTDTTGTPPKAEEKHEETPVEEPEEEMAQGPGEEEDGGDEGFVPEGDTDEERLESAREKYHEVFDKKPHHKKGIDSLVSDINDELNKNS